MGKIQTEDRNRFILESDVQRYICLLAPHIREALNVEASGNDKSSMLIGNLITMLKEYSGGNWWGSYTFSFQGNEVLRARLNRSVSGNKISFDLMGDSEST